MDLQSLAAWAQIIGAFSVVISIVGLIATIRQSTKFQKALVVDSLAAAIAAINVPCTESPALGSAISKAVTDWASATREERIMAHYFLFSFFKLSENAWYQQRAKVLGPAQWFGWDVLLRKYYHSAGVREVWWPNRRNTYSPDFQNYLTQTEPPAEVGSLKDIFDFAPPGAAPAGAPVDR
jgi:hypothetical protein